MCKSEECGGIGIINLEVFNKALLMKWKWRIVNDMGAIWRGFTKHKYNKPKVKMFISDVCAINRVDSIWRGYLILIDSVEDGKVTVFLIILCARSKMATPLHFGLAIGLVANR